MEYICIIMNTLNRINNQETLALLGKALRERRTSMRLAQSAVRGIRQATISKIERGGDVTLDTLIGYAAALGLELVFAPIGQRASLAKAAMDNVKSTDNGASTLDLLDEFADLRDEPQ